MPKFYVQTFARIYLGGIEVDAFCYHDAAVKAERKVRRELVEDKGEEGSLITGQYLQVIEAEVHLGDPNSPYERTRFLQLATGGTEDYPPEFDEQTNLVWEDHKCSPRGDIHEWVAETE
jgi:hypothetical protein